MLNSNMFHSNTISKKSLIRSLFLIIFSFTIASCGGSDGDGGSSSSSSSSSSSGGSSSSSSGGSSSSSSSGGVSGVEPVTPLTISKNSTFDLLGRQISLTGEGGSDGDIEVVVGGTTPPSLRLALESDPGDFENNFPQLQLKEGVPSISVKAVQRTMAIDFSCDDGTGIRSSTSSDFVTGVVNSQGVVDGANLSCTSTFQSVLPTTIPGMFTVKGLLEDWGTDDDKSKPIEETGLISTTCPQDGSGFDDNNPFFENCSGSILTNYRVTDSSDRVHNAASKITFSSTGSGGGLPDLPTIPEIPDFPAAPSVPGVPDVPGIPDIPDIPDIPEIPGFPDGIPGFPDGIPGFPDGIPGFPDGLPASRTVTGEQ